ncbi:YggT family protein [Zhihengliuella salsuginis]|uniref:Hemolysin n=1 Tax=Zhihengliuella salsuginis TaxID=578222 RepID=A0ABQ3GC32_9MICC|nr:YggT family protein [Zhihengliuella salsuginis]GHD00986.1 hemolysin [Zhihengliuella salsuginis]
MELLLALVYIVLTVFQVVLMIRIVYDVVQMFARSWRPSGLALVVASFVYRMTDPPMRWLRSKVKPLDLGGMRLDLAFLILFFAVVIAKLVVSSIAQ